MNTPKILAVAAFVLFTTAAAWADSFADANAKYQAGDFKAAAAGYRSIIEGGSASVAVHYNLGNTEFRLGHKGKAMAAYLRALELAPRDPDVRWNLHILKSVVQDRIEPAQGGWPEWLSAQAAWVTAREAALAVAASLAALAGFAFLALVFPPVRGALRLPRAAAFLLLLVSGAALYLRLGDEGEPRAVILGREVYARYGPSLKETKAFTLHEGAEGRVLDQTKDWLFLRLSDRNAGWVPRDSCEIV
ncbi:MAG TPA: tetratricopeptide repeat protein [Candidatus Eisenbacteria bacterium]|jgi:tetratricopeptide (TPR) repeat protein|nr:tetratricopeptide repeat protein [Candidatus Eisenbacteria bacterium]